MEIGLLNVISPLRGVCTQWPRAASGKRNLNGSFKAMSLELGSSRPDPLLTLGFWQATAATASQETFTVMTMKLVDFSEALPSKELYFYRGRQFAANSAPTL